MAETLCALMKKGGGGYNIKLDASNQFTFFNIQPNVTNISVTSDPMAAGTYLAYGESYDITSSQPQKRGCTLSTTGTKVENYVYGGESAIIELPANGTVTATGATLTARGRNVNLIMWKIK